MNSDARKTVLVVDDEADVRHFLKAALVEAGFNVVIASDGFEAMEEVKRQIDLDNTHYCDPQGILSLRKAVARQISETRGIRAEAERVVVFPGGKPPIGLCQQTYCGPGDEVVYPSPGFPIYESFVPYVGATPVPVHLKEENAFSLSGEELASKLSERTKLIFLNFPSNPTGGVASPEQLQGIADVIRTRCCDDVRIFSDEIY
ncbi:MAG: aminotransferase class I/II-fold pyridoxal phosphate-dependent enzyme, partial [bacterium]